MTMPGSSRRGDGWSGERQRAFCEALAQGSSVARACEMLGMSASSAYAFRSSARGAAFAIGWSAAQLLQRHRLADALAERALEGQVVTVTRADGTQSERHLFDNRLAMAVLTRLDRQAAADHDAAAADGDGHAARLAAGEFDRYLDLLAADAAPARAAMFIALRGADRAAAPISPRSPASAVPISICAWVRAWRRRSTSPISTSPPAPAGPRINGRAPRPPA
ncbi:MAG TPA: hypothetical protein VF638_16635 [Sphingomonas sp.]|jgi:hypothetical protein